MHLRTNARTTCPLSSVLSYVCEYRSFSVHLKRLLSCEDHSGSTCIASFISQTHIIIANCGDSRAVLARGGNVHFSSVDHKPTDAGETARIQGAGGFIEMGRVCGNLAVSRSLADFQYKDRADLPATKQKVTAASDMTTIARDASDEFLLLCCDGIWDVMSNEDAVEFVSNHLKVRSFPTFSTPTED